MSGSLLNVALSGLRAAQVGMNTTSHNIANVNTPGYSRQSAYQVSQEAVRYGSGWVGSGTQVREITRSYSDLLAAQVRAAQAQASRSSVYTENVTQLNVLLSDSNSSVSSALSSFFASVQSVTVNPGDAALRQAVFNNAHSVVQRFHGLDTSLTQQRDQINQRLDHLVADVNGRTQEIAQLNDRIVYAQSSGHSPNDLLDQRDAMLTELNKLVGITVTSDADGSINVYLNSGQGLVQGNVVQKLGLKQDPLLPDAPTVGVVSGNTVTSIAGNGDIGGEVGGLLAVRDEAVTGVQTALGRLARVFSETLNARNQLGLDINGNPGGDLFAIEAPATVAASTNTGGATITTSITDASALQASDYRIEVTSSGYTVTRLSDKQAQTFAAAPINIDGLQFDVSGAGAVGDRFSVRAMSGAISTLRLALSDATGLATALPLRIDPANTNTSTTTAQVTIDADDPALHDPAQLTFDGAGNVTVTTGSGSTVLPFTPGTDIAMNGWRVTVRGVPAAGDVFQIGANTAVAGDNRNANAMAALEGAQVLPRLTFNGTYASLVVDIGTKGRDAQAAADASAGLADSLSRTQDSLTGVNLDEEAVNLMRYQHAYQAAARMITVANSLFESILSM